MRSEEIPRVVWTDGHTRKRSCKEREPSHIRNSRRARNAIDFDKGGTKKEG